MDKPATVFREVVCPFCALGCDDLVIAIEGVGPRLLGPECQLAAQGFGQIATATGPLVAGLPATVEAAIERAVELLRGSALPLFGGLGTDVAGMRAVLALAESTGGIVDHGGSRGLLANIRAMQDGGTVTATLAEVRNRADLVLVVATDVNAVAPRFAERCLAPTSGLFGALSRELVHLGPGAPLAGAEVLPCDVEQIGEVLAVLRSLAADERVAADVVAGLSIAALGKLATRLRAAAYPVIVWAAGELPGRHPDLVTTTLAGLLRELNAKGRCCGLPLTGGDNVVGANQVCGWQTGGPLRTSFAGGAPDHDPVRWSTEAALAAADCLFWVSSFGTQSLPPSWDGPTIALVRPGHELPPGVAVVIPVATPGLDHAGSIYRTDGVVALPLRALRTSTLPTAATVLAGIRTRLAAGRPS